jgi:hypothetical protein
LRGQAVRRMRSATGLGMNLYQTSGSLRATVAAVRQAKVNSYQAFSEITDCSGSNSNWTNLGAKSLGRPKQAKMGILISR